MPSCIPFCVMSSEKPADWLVKRSQHSIRDLLLVHMGPGSQSFQLDFNNEGVLYTIVIRDAQMCEAFVTHLEGRWSLVRYSC